MSMALANAERTGNLSCAYPHPVGAMTQPLPMEWNPRAVERLFGDSGSTDRAPARHGCGSTKHPRLGHESWQVSRKIWGRRPEQHKYRGGSRRRARLASRSTARPRAAQSSNPSAPAASRSPRADAGPQRPGISVDLITFMTAGAERAPVSPDRRTRGAPSPVASRQRARAHRAHVEDQQVSHPVVLAVPGQTSRHT